MDLVRYMRDEFDRILVLHRHAQAGLAQPAQIVGIQARLMREHEQALFAAIRG